MSEFEAITTAGRFPTTVQTTANGKLRPHLTSTSSTTSSYSKRASLRDPQPLIVNEKKYVEPPDGGWGWVVVVAVWIDNCLVIGMLKSLGVLFPEFRTYFQGSAGAISWINSISLSMRASAAPLAAALSNKYGERKVVAWGATLVTIGLIISMFATSPYYLYVSLGCVSGFGFALASLPALTMIGRYFKTKRSLANGLSRSGGGATFFLAPVLQLLVDLYGWQGCLLVVAGMELHLFACALLLRPVRLKDELKFDHRETLQRHRDSIMPPSVNEESFNNAEEGYKLVARRALAEKQRLKQQQKEIEKRVTEYGITESLIVDHFPQIEPVYQPQKKKALDFSLLKNPLWAVVTTNLVMTQFGYSITLVHTVARAKILGIGEYESAMLLSLIGLSEVIAQLTSGYFADKGYLRRIHLHKIYITVMGIASAFSLLANSFLTMAIYCIVFGCGSGSWQGNILPVTVDTLGVRQLRSAYGFCLFFSGVCGQLIGPPVAGALFDATQSYTYSFIVATCCFFAAMLVLWLEIPAARYLQRKEDSSNGVAEVPDEQDIGMLLEMHSMT
uniref:Monocarboxylate transporter 5-like n=1 Tax=Phallusia mammillata TaxID=59560 RepID=A0A6F9DSX4_9ASCI|nr:monocarboxylate transporter 5-like [Phallusia mammillata]